MSDKNKFYNGNALLGYNEPFNFSLGNRSAGKSFFWKHRMVKRFIDKGEQFVIVKRYQEDLDLTLKEFFGDIAFKFPGHEFNVVRNALFVDGEQAGYAMPLSKAQRYKGVSLPNVEMIFFDEFLPEDGRYLKNEWEKALNLYQTVARGGGKAIRDSVNFVFVANNVSLYNPYFRALGIRPKPGAKYIRGPACVVELFHNEGIAEEINKSRVGPLLSTGSYGNYAQGGSFMLDNNKFIKPLPANNRYITTIKSDGEYYGLYRGEDGCYYVSSKAKKDYHNIFVFSNDDHDLDYFYIDNFRRSETFSNLSLYYERGKLFFTNQNAKNTMLEILQYM